ncbi:glycine cleavage system H protein [Opitutaceae bacterium TAV1]|nr:glycine cleavage system H protein [Opitutaceae bacterium TAV1]
MSNVPASFLYAKSHEWLQPTGADTATIGITDYAQASLGDITYVQLPKVGATFAAGESFGVVESVKAASDIYAPVALTVVEINAGLDAEPQRVNQSPYDEGWLIRVKLAAPLDPLAPGALLDATAYTAAIGE